MIRRFLRSAIHNATVNTGGDGRLRIDPVILRAAGILPLEAVTIVTVSGERVDTWIEAAAEGSGTVEFNGAGVITILAWGLLHDGQTLDHRATVVTLDAHNRVFAIEEH